MKIFWSWQADTHGKTGRHFVRDALSKAIEELKQPDDVEEPLEREARENVHLDQDRQGVPGSPDLAATIFKKIDDAAVFVSDMTLVAEIRDADGNVKKRLINPNVALECGYALRALTDASVLMVQNTHYGSRDELPFDLRHKAGPLQYDLAPGATKKEIAAEHIKLRATFVAALRPYLLQGKGTATAPEPFQETEATTKCGIFWQPGDVLAVAGATPYASATGRQDAEQIDYRFDEPRIFYLRLIPTKALPEKLRITTIADIVEKRLLHGLSKYSHSVVGCRNNFGAIAYQPQTSGNTLVALSQLFRNGEIWGVSSTLIATHNRALVIPMVMLVDVYERAIANFMKVASEHMGITPPYTIEFGAVGLKGVHTSIPQHMNPFANQISDSIFENELVIRRVLNSNESAAIDRIVEDFSRQLFDLAGIDPG
jgi:hypothetical protein